METPEKELEQLLQTITSNSAVVDQAFKALCDAAAGYKSSRPIVDACGRRAKPLIANGREKLKKLHKMLQRAHDATSDLPIDARTMFCDAYGTPMGRFLQELERAVEAARNAHDIAQKQADRTPDFERNILAYGVALVFRDILKLTPASSRDTADNITGERGGAAYARTLRATLKLAGVASADIGPLIDAGLHLLSDGALPFIVND